MNPLPFNQTAYKGEDFVFSVSLKNGSTNTAFDLTGCTFLSVLKAGVGGPTVATLNVSSSLPTTGVLTVDISKTVIQKLNPFPYNLLLWLTTPDSVKTLIVDGTLTLVSA